MRSWLALTSASAIQLQVLFQNASQCSITPIMLTFTKVMQNPASVHAAQLAYAHACRLSTGQAGLLHLRLRSTIQLSIQLQHLLHVVVAQTLSTQPSIDSGCPVRGRLHRRHSQAQTTEYAQSCAGAAGICVRLLLSIDRRETTQQALATVNLAAEHLHRGVVGIDLSGNPSIGHLDTWLPALQLAKQKGLKLTLHAAEVRWAHPAYVCQM